jgi:hypothetical protein
LISQHHKKKKKEKRKIRGRKNILFKNATGKPTEHTGGGAIESVSLFLDIMF